jgi:hypothetical protein
VTDVVGDVLDESHFDGLTRIGIDEVSCRKGHRCLTVVVDHGQQGRAVWAHEGKNAATLGALFDELGPSESRNSRPSDWIWDSPSRKRPARRRPTFASASILSTS